MKIRCTPANALTDEQLEAWSEIQGSNPELDNPHFCAEFVRQVAAVRGVEVAVLENGGGILGLLPFHRDRRNRATAVAGNLSDFEGAVVRADATLDACQLVRDCGVRSWRFRSQLASQSGFARFHAVEIESPYMDLSNGFEAYRKERRKSGKTELQEALRKGRKIERDFGDVRFEPFSQSDEVFETLWSWKVEQLRRTKARGLLGLPWARDLLANIARTRTDEFSGMLSALHVGDQLAAASLSITSRRVLHGWVMAFNREFAKYSPGLILLTRLAQECEAMGIERIDMGRGPESFKRSFCSGSTRLAEGVVSRRCGMTAVERRWLRFQEVVRRSPFSGPARRMYGMMRGTN